jgi:uncharacterized membrane protein YdjX (TVP38/TMEM64 family)
MRWLVVSVIFLAFILIPFFLLEEPINARVDELMRGRLNRPILAAAIVSLLALDILLPVPSSIVSTAAGASLGLGPGVLASTTGMTLGCVVGYALGRKLGLPVVRRQISDRELERVAARFRKGALWALASMRAVPVLAEASTLFAGVTRVPFPAYLGITTLANAGISIIYGAVGARALDSGSFLLAFAGSVVLPGLAMLLDRLLKRAFRRS